MLRKSVHKKEWNNAIYTNKDATRDYLTKWCKSKRQIPCDITYMWNLKYGTNKPIYKIETDLQTQRIGLWLPKGRSELGVWGWQMQTITFRMDEQDPSIQHRELYSISCEKTIREKNIKKNIFVCITESLCYTVEIGPTLQINYTSIKKLNLKKKFKNK